MDAFLQILILVAFLLGGVLLYAIKLAPKPRVTDWIIKIVLWALLGVMGFRLGNSRELSAQLGTLGALAGLVALCAVAGTIAAINLAYWLLRLAGKRGAAVSQITAANHGPSSPKASGKILAFDPRRFKGSGLLLLMVFIGFLAGAVLPEFPELNYGSITAWVLNALLFMIGVQFAQSGISLRSAFVRADTLIVPLATIAGSLAGGLLAGLPFGLGAGKSLALAAGFGWYSLSGVLIADLGDPALGSAAFLANLIREAIALVIIPLLAMTKRPYAAIGVGGATAMDVTLPLVEQCVGPEAVPVSFASGALLSLLVPVLVPLFFSLG